MKDGLEMKGRSVSPGRARGEALVSQQAIGFYGGVDAETGLVIEKDHELEGQNVKGRILVFPQGKGSTVGSYTLYRMKKEGTAPIAILNRECETIVAVGAIIAEIPCLDQIEIERIPDDAVLLVDGDAGKVDF